MTAHRIVRREVRQRGFFGKLFKFTFIAFNVLMLVWLLSYWVQVGEMSQAQTDEWARTGVGIGATIGTGMLLFFWVAGSVILGLLTLITRGQTTIIEEET